MYICTYRFPVLGLLGPVHTVLVLDSVCLDIINIRASDPTRYRIVSQITFDTLRSGEATTRHRTESARRSIPDRETNSLFSVQLDYGVVTSTSSCCYVHYYSLHTVARPSHGGGCHACAQAATS
jgi:hypothetical protein